MATNSSFTDQYDKKVDELLACIDSSSSSGEEASDFSGNRAFALKSVKQASRGQRLMEDELKLLVKHYKVIVKEKNAVIEEKNRMMEEMRNNLTKEQDQLKKKQVDDRKHFEKEVSQIKAQLDELKLFKEKDDKIEKLKQQVNEKPQQTTSEQQTQQLSVLTEIQVEDRKRLEAKFSEVKEKFDEQVKLVEKKDNQIEILKQQINLLKQRQLQLQHQTSELQSTSLNYSKEVVMTRCNRFLELGIYLAERPGGGVYLSWVKPGSPAAIAGLRAGERVLKVGGIDLRQATISRIIQVLSLCPQVIRMVVDAPMGQQNEIFYRLIQSASNSSEKQ